MCSGSFGIQKKLIRGGLHRISSPEDDDVAVEARGGGDRPDEIERVLLKVGGSRRVVCVLHSCVHARACICLNCLHGWCDCGPNANSIDATTSALLILTNCEHHHLGLE